jgi:imidazolonepropionase-like amidohydrolase
MGLGDELGSLEPGKKADLVAIEGDPFAFDDLQQRIRAVYQDGRLVAGGPI